MDFIKIFCYLMSHFDFGRTLRICHNTVRPDFFLFVGIRYMN